MVERGSRTVDDRLVSKIILSQEMANLFGAQGQLKRVKHSKTCPLCDVTKRKPHTQNKYFFIETRSDAESIDGLNSALAQSAGQLQRCKPSPKFWQVRDFKGSESVSVCSNAQLV